MIDVDLLLSFLLVSVTLIVIPGPNVLVILSTSITHGRQRGLQTVAGTTTAMALQMGLAAIATHWFVDQLGQGIAVVKWVGIAYLLFLGWKQLYNAIWASKIADRVSATGSFSNGFYVSLANPKTIGFFAAFLPQFVSDPTNYLVQIGILSFIFLTLAATIDSVYALVGVRLQPWLCKYKVARMHQIFSGLLLICAGTWLALLQNM